MSNEEERVARSEALLEKGLDLVDEGEYEKALEIAAQLEEARYTGSFQIEGEVHAARGDLKAAVEALERGVAFAPESWRLWHLLGNHRAQNDDFEEAAAAYSKALEHETSWVEAIRLDQAILALRANEPARTLEYLADVKDAELLDHKNVVALDAHLTLGDLEATTALAESILQSKGPEGGLGTAEALMALARVGLQKGASNAEARELLDKAFQSDRGNAEVLECFRELRPRRSDAANFYRILVHGAFAPEDPFHQEAEGFFASYDVVSDSSEEAMELIRDLERLRDDTVLVIEEHRELQSGVKELKGVYSCTGWTLYDERS